MYKLWKNLTYAARRLAERPGFALTAVLSLALGIGANTAIFSLVNAVLLRELPLRAAEELVDVYLSSPDFEYGVFSYPDYRDFRDGTASVLSDVAATRLVLAQADSADGVEMLPCEAVSGNYFETLGVEAQLGRALTPEDDIARGAHPVVVLGHGYWQSAYGGNPEVVGQEIRLGGRPYEIVGVAPEAYTGNLRGLQPSLYAPIMMVNQLQPGTIDELEARGNHSIFVKARRRPGVSDAQLQAAVDGVAEHIREQAPEDWDPQASFLLVPTNEVILFPPFDRFVRAAAWLLMAVVGVVLFMACLNLASFLLARAIDRKKEIALRLALGAARRDLVAQLLTETMFLAVLGGLCGVALAVSLLDLLMHADLPLPLPITLDLSLDGNVLGFSLLTTIAAGMLLGLVPALQATNPDLAPVLKDESAGGGQKGSLSLRNGLVVVQVAASMVLLVAAGLFLRSFQQVQNVDPGFGGDPSAVLTIIVPSTRYSEEEGAQFVRNMLKRFEAHPGVESVGLTSNLHLNTLNIQNMSVNVDGVEPPSGRESHTVDRTTVDPGFFDAAGVRILRGRNFDDGDRPDSTQVAIISEAMAERFWSDRDPIGQTIRRPSPDDSDLLVVGIARDAKVRSLGEPPRPFVYRPYSQAYTSFITVVARSSTDPARTALELVRVGRELDPQLSVWEAKTMERHLGIVLLPARLAAGILSVFAVLALTLASIGLYGIVSYAVSQRTREVGIRVSLGANGGNIVSMLMRSGLKLVAVGALVGLALALAATPILQSLLFGIRAIDALTFLLVPILLLSVAALAAYLPAQRASRIDPVRALRAE